MQKDTFKTKVLLYSGGMDSWLIDKIWRPDRKIFVDVGTPASAEERKRLPADVIVLDFPLLGRFEMPDKNYLLPLRNFFLVLLASYYGDIICLGSEAGSRHRDNGRRFARKLTRIINCCLSEIPGRKVKVVTPFAHMTKAELLSEYVKRGGDIKEAWENSFSCYAPINGKECGNCRSCRQKLAAFQLLNFNPADVLRNQNT